MTEDTDRTGGAVDEDAAPRSWWPLVVGGVALVAVVVVVVVLTGGDSSGDSGDDLRANEPVGRGSLESTVVTRGVVGHASQAELVAGVAGRLTGLEVETGDVIEAGAVLWRIDGRPAVAVAGDTPLWRELSAGSNGPDVEVVQQMLSDQGVEVSVTRDFDDGTEQVVRMWQADHGFASPDGIVRPSDLVVTSLPARVGSTPTDLGAFVEPATPLVTTTATEVSVTVELNPSDRARIEQGDPARVTLSATGETVEGEVVLASTEPQTREDGTLYYAGDVALGDNTFDEVDGAQSEVRIVIEQVTDVLTVPLSAVVSGTDGESAVRVIGDDDQTELVSIELGLSEGGLVEVVSGLDGDEEVVVAQAGSPGGSRDGP